MGTIAEIPVSFAAVAEISVRTSGWRISLPVALTREHKPGGDQRESQNGGNVQRAGPEGR